MTRIRQPTADRERGSLALELVVLTPVLVLVLWLFGVFALRAMLLHGQVDAAARDAARAASIARAPAAARAAAATAAAASLGQARALCQTVTTDVDISRFVAGGSVRVTIACTVGLDDLGLLGIPGSRAVRATYAAPVDLHRGVQP